MSNKLEQTMEEIDFRKIKELCVGAAERTHDQTKGRHKMKLERLLKKRGVSLRSKGVGSEPVEEGAYIRTGRNIVSVSELSPRNILFIFSSIL